MKKFLVLCLAAVCLSGFVSCAGITLKQPSQVEEVGLTIGARRAGYMIGQNNPGKIPQWKEWGEQITALKAGDTTLSLEVALSKAFDLVDSNDPLLKDDVMDLISLFDFPALQPPDMTTLTEAYLSRVHIIVKAFCVGLKKAAPVEIITFSFKD